MHRWCQWVSIHRGFSISAGDIQLSISKFRKSIGSRTCESLLNVKLMREAALVSDFNGLCPCGSLSFSILCPFVFLRFLLQHLQPPRWSGFWLEDVGWGGWALLGVMGQKMSRLQAPHAAQERSAHVAVVGRVGVLDWGHYRRERSKDWPRAAERGRS